MSRLSSWSAATRFAVPASGKPCANCRNAPTSSSRDISDACQEDLERWEANIRPGTLLNSGPAISRLADRGDLTASDSARQAIEHLQTDLRDFRDRHKLDRVVVVNVSSTEAPFDSGEVHESLERLTPALDRRQSPLPASSLYAWAALDLGLPYINFTPSLGASTPALRELAHQRRAVLGGKDGKTGETLLKTRSCPDVCPAQLATAQLGRP